MQRKHKLAIALGLLAVVSTVEMAQARSFTFSGTRSQVARACIGPGRVWSSGFDGYGVGYALCIDTVRDTSVICDDTGSCVGSVPLKATPKPRKPRGTDYQVPKSLSEPVHGATAEMGEVGTDAPAPEPDIID